MIFFLILQFLINGVAGFGIGYFARKKLYNLVILCVAVIAINTCIWLTVY